MSTPVDTLPAAKTVTPKAKVSSGKSVAASLPAPTSIAAGRARLKRRRLTGDEYRTAKAMASSVTGYNDTSPIWGKRLPVVLQEIEVLVQDGIKLMDTGSYGDARAKLEKAATFNSELQKRIATNKIMGSM